MLDGRTQKVWVPVLVLEYFVCQITNGLGPDPPFIRTGGSSKGEPQRHDGYDGCVWILPSCYNHPVYEAEDAMTKHAEEKLVLLHPAVD
eukprot:4449472-Ditylum_brightwellii.AAC.2